MKSEMVKPDSDYLRLSRDLRFEATRANAGETVDDVKGVPTGKAYGSHHEERLKSDRAYCEAYATALIATADAAEARGMLGVVDEIEPPASRGVQVAIRDPQTGELVVVRRADGDTPLDRARYSSAEPITDMQWLAGTMYEADASGEASYRGNSEIIAANGNFRLQAVVAETTSAPTGEIHNDDALLTHDPSDDVMSNAWRFARVSRSMAQGERRSAKAWLVDHVEPKAGDLRDLLDKLVNLYATHDEHFAFNVWRHGFATLPHLSEAANDNDRPLRTRRAKRR